MKRLSALLLGVGLSVVAQSASAQEIIGIQEQIDAIKEEMRILNNKVYYSNMGQEVSPSRSAAAQEVVQAGRDDESMRKMDGKLDELEYKVKQLNDRIDALNRDIDVRFNLLEGKPIPAGEGSVATPKKFDAAVASGAPKSIVGDTVTTGDLKNLTPTKTVATPLIEEPALNQNEQIKTADELYNAGLQALKAGKASEAEQNMLLILDRYPSDKLAGNAQYWLGETYYSQKDFKKAAVAFAKGYQNYKNGAKGADSLLKLGLSVEQLGQKTEACSAFIQLPIEFPKADASIKTKAQSEVKKLGCK